MQTINEATMQFVRQHRQDDVRQLRLGRAPQDVDLRQACVQIVAWQRARTKLPTWAQTDGIVFPEQISMEQCSSELTARYKADIIVQLQPQTVADLTGGFGVDATMLARVHDDVRLTFVERHAELCELARHNLPLLGVRQLEVLCGDAVELLERLPHQDLIFLDPARRDEHGSRTYAIGDCTPDVEPWQERLLERADTVMIKLSPMLDLSDALHRLHPVQQVHVVSVDGECKEVLLVLKKLPINSEHLEKMQMQESSPGREELEGALFYCVNLSERHERQNFCFTREEEQQAVCPYATELGRYLYEPNASVLKAGAYKCVAQRFGLLKLHPNSHLYTADTWVEDFPGRRFEVAGVSDFNKHKLKDLLADVLQANLTVRNYPQSVAELRRRLKIAEGGSDYLFATTLADERRVLVRGLKPKT